MSQQGHTLAELESLDTVMSEQLGEEAACNQPCRLREEIHSGRSKIKQADGHALLVKQHPEHHLVVKIVIEREQQRVAEGNLRREVPNVNPSSSSSSQRDGWWTIS